MINVIYLLLIYENIGNYVINIVINANKVYSVIVKLWVIFLFFRFFGIYSLCTFFFVKKANFKLSFELNFACR